MDLHRKMINEILEEVIEEINEETALLNENNFGNAVNTMNCPENS